MRVTIPSAFRQMNMKYVAFEMNCMDMTAVVEIEPGVYLVETVSLYLDDDSFSEEQLLEGLSTKYFTKQ